MMISLGLFHFIHFVFCKISVCVPAQLIAFKMPVKQMEKIFIERERIDY